MQKAFKKKRTIAIGLTAILVLVFSWYLFDRFSYSKAYSFYPVNADADTSLTIGIIGASSAAAAQFDVFLHNSLLEKGINNKVISSGHPGATTKLIYQNLFSENKKEHSSRFIIENSPDYCIVIGGINDAVSQQGSNFYAYHMTQITKTLLHYKIKPVIVSLPRFGIKEATANLNFFNRYMNKAAAYFNNHGETDNIEAYRKALEKNLTVENLKDSIIMIDFDKLCPGYDKCPGFFADPVHLSPKGKEMLCRLIANELAVNIKFRFY